MMENDKKDAGEDTGVRVVNQVGGTKIVWREDGKKNIKE